MDNKYLSTIINYNPETGVFTWTKNRGKIKEGTQAGFINKRGWRLIKINKTEYRAGRLAFFIINNRWPEELIDHINGVRADDRLCNLKEVSSRENTQNKIRHREGHLQGAWQIKNNSKWYSQIYSNGIKKHLGVFETEKEAHNAYIKACQGVS